MGRDLIVAAIETGPRTRIRFDRALAKLSRMSDAELAEGFCRATERDREDVVDAYCLEVPSIRDEMSPERWAQIRDEAIAVAARRRAEEGLVVLENMWNSRHRDATWVQLRRSVVLIAGGPSWGDVPFEGYDEVILTIALGLTRTAGFWN